MYEDYGNIFVEKIPLFVTTFDIHREYLIGRR